MTNIRTLKETEDIGNFLFNDPHLSDITFKVSQETFYGHKLILAAKSEVFYTLFYGSIPFKDGELEVSDLSAKTFSKLLNFLYTDNVTLDNVEANILVELLYGAKKYMMKDLITICVKNMLSSQEAKINIEPNFPLIIYLSSALHPELVRSTCHEGMQLNTRHVFASEMFMNADLPLIYDFISYINTQNLEPKALIFEFLLQWGSKECKKRRIGISYENVIKILKDSKFEPLSYIEQLSLPDIIEFRKQKILGESKISDLLLKILGKRLGVTATTLPYKRFFSITTLPASSVLVEPLFCRQIYIFKIKLSTSTGGTAMVILSDDDDNPIFNLEVVIAVSSYEFSLPNIPLYPSNTCEIKINTSCVNIQWSANNIEMINSEKSVIQIIYYK
ncbi:unnamed protein product [Gordionus sp. m RMFG-2023]